MSKIFQLEGGQYEHPNEYKLVSTIRGTTILQPEFGTVIIEGDVIEASTHNTIQKNGVLASKVNVTMESTDTVLVPTDMTIESDLFNELKIMLLFETGTTLPSNSFIKLKNTNIPIANVNEYIVNANTPLLFLYFDSKFYAYKAGEGAESLSSTYVKKTDIATQTEVDAGVEDTKIVTSKKLKARLDSLLAGITSTYVKLTQLATETAAGIVTEARIKEISKSMLDDLKKNIFENMHPVGSIYTTTSEGFDPNALFGGLWERYAQGRTLIGVSDNDPAFSNAGLTGGTKTKTLDLINLPAHTHTATFAGSAVGNHTHTVDNHTHLVPDHEHQVFLSGWAESGGTAGHMASGGNNREILPSLMDGYAQGGSVWSQGSQPGTSGSGAHTPSGSVTVTSTGQGREFDIINPYITVYFWKRVG